MFARKLILLWHVLQAIPIYHFMSMKLHVNGYWMLEGVCRNFLWEKNEVENHKRTLVAWKHTARNRAEGGLGIEPFREKSCALCMHWCSKLLREPDISWIQLAKTIIKRCLGAGPGCKTKRNWIAIEGILLDDNLYILASPFLRDLIHGFQSASNSHVLRGGMFTTFAHSQATTFALQS